MTSNVCDKVDVSRVLIQRTKGLHSKARVSSIQAADIVLKNWADGVPAAEDDQCDVQVIFEDGFRYRGKFGLKHTEKRISLARHIRRQLTALAAAKRCSNAAAANDEPVISLIGTDIADSARIALDQYDI
ncbi:hypothetical protein [Noviherbaspirillum saxi]|uniref:Uncharacterized protein n=1 Tax=Noviherbaspirillum saxi TaxID=2320863 RepID=A0A3A3FMG9_9BURK|nr:hypothetical protein [Noviherbaspirillum saxi]RJF95921.1 hypothetical protein D3871_21430 [Noviherbaspirillum saxi]